MAKPKVGFYWCASCGGCEETVVDLAEDVLKVVEAVDIVFWPCAMDFKRSDLEAMADGEMTACFVNGAIRNSEQLEMVEIIRKKTQVLLSFGSCAHQGGIPSLANLHDRSTVLETAYQGTVSTVNPEKTRPLEKTAVDGKPLTLPDLWNTVYALHHVVPVDYFVPGCPPTPKVLMNAVQALLSGNLPPKGSVLAPNIALCDECPRKESKPSDLKLYEYKRPHKHPIDPEKCILAQGFLCMGPATRSGCGALCIEGNMPCTGCFGPTDQVHDQGAKALSAFASTVGSNDEAEIVKALEGIVDPVGTFYRYGLACSTLHRKGTPDDAAPAKPAVKGA